MKSSSEMLQNLPYFIYTKTQSCFFRFLFRATLYFPPNECPGLCQHRPGRQKKQLRVFVYTYKIWQILKHFAGTFHRAQTLKLEGV